MTSTQQNEGWRGAFERGWVTGTYASVLSGIALMAASKLHRGNFSAALNGPSQWLWGHLESMKPGFRFRRTVVGGVIHHLSAVFWGVLHERAFGGGSKQAPIAREVASAAVTTAIAYTVDYHLTPPRLRPGFRKHLDDRAVTAVYVCFGLGLLAAALHRRAAGRGQAMRAPAGAKLSGA
jgi:hypothetical protein